MVYYKNSSFEEMITALSSCPSGKDYGGGVSVVCHQLSVISEGLLVPFDKYSILDSKRRNRWLPPY